MRVNLPDAFYVNLEHRAAMDQMPIEDWIVAQLRRVRHCPVEDRIIVVGRDARETLEGLLGGGHLVDDSDLVAKVARLAVLHIGELSTNFSPGQWEEFERRCTRAGLDMRVEAQRIVDKVGELFFDHVGA